MADVFKRARDRQQDKDPKRPASKWRGWVTYHTDDGRKFRKEKALHQTKAMARKLMQELQFKADLESVNPKKAAERPLLDHLKAYEKFLLNRQDTKKHVEDMCRCIRQMLALGNIHIAAELTEERMTGAQAQFKDSGRSIRSCNKCLHAMQAFNKWLVLNNKATINLIAAIKPDNIERDRHRVRVVLDDAQIERLLAATAVAPKLRGLTGPQRCVVYQLGLYVGLRANEIRLLRWKDISIDGDKPTITIPIATAKARRSTGTGDAILPLLFGMDAVLREYRDACIGRGKLFKT